ncbi:MAG: hypothetical protein QGF20_18085, partial [Alphaproteobacteria bacterium]|nr:hypothetical protein [Alphaproteobacteria bacterium]
LQGADLIKATADQPPTYLPARPFEVVTVDEVLAATRHGGKGGDISFDRISAPDGIDAILQQFETATSAALAGKTVKELALGPDGGRE